MTIYRRFVNCVMVLVLVGLAATSPGAGATHLNQYSTQRYSSYWNTLPTVTAYSAFNWDQQSSPGYTQSAPQEKIEETSQTEETVQVASVSTPRLR